jgi:hypothetical protein
MLFGCPLVLRDYCQVLAGNINILYVSRIANSRGCMAVDVAIKVLKRWKAWQMGVMVGHEPVGAACAGT